MSPLEDVRIQMEAELRAAVGKAVPDAAEKHWLAELGADMAAQRIRQFTATTPEERARIQENLEVLAARWSVRLGEKELLANQTAEKVTKIALGVVMNFALPALGPAGGIAKIVIEQTMKRMGQSEGA